MYQGKLTVKYSWFITFNPHPTSNLPAALVGETETKITGAIAKVWARRAQRVLERTLESLGRTRRSRRTIAGESSHT